MKDGKWKLRRVLETFTRINDDSLLSLIYRDGSIQVTPGHPFWVLRGEDVESRPWPKHAGERLTDAAIPGRWVDAGDLRVGDVLYLRSGEERVIEEIQVLARGQRVYNFRVEELACYAVGSDSVLVHNASGDLTEPTLPNKTIVEQGPFKVEHYTRSNDHPPAHGHLYENGRFQTRIGANGKPLAGNPPLTQSQKRFVSNNLGTIRRGVNKIRRWWKWKGILRRRIEAGGE